MTTQAAWLTIVGIGEDGWSGLGDAARDAIRQARLLLGGSRHLALIPEIPAQERRPWPSPFAAAFERILACRGMPVCILASGDPLFYGIGSSLAAHLDAAEMRVLPAPSAFSLAAARLGWGLQDVALLTVHGRPLARLVPYLHPEARLLVLSENARTPAAIAALLREQGFAASRLTVLEHLNGPQERRQDGVAADWSHPPGADLNLVAVQCRAEPGHRGWSGLAGLPDAAYRHDGQLTKRDARAAALARLAPEPGKVLWDVGAGCGSIGIEWMRSHPTCRAFAIEAAHARQTLIRHNSLALGVPDLVVVAGQAPGALHGLPAPDAIFIGGGLTTPGVPETCWQALKPGGRLVANAVTVQSEMALVAWQMAIGGDLTRLSVSHIGSLGEFACWRPALPVTLFVADKPLSP